MIDFSIVIVIQIVYVLLDFEINIKSSYLFPYYLTWTTVRIAAIRLGR